MADESGSSGGGSPPAAPPPSLEDHNPKVGIVQWPHRKKKRPRTGNRLLDLAAH